MSKEWNDDSKATLRPDLFRGCKKGAKRALFMPSNTCYCLIEALKQGVITKTTQLVLIERERSRIKELEAKLHELGLTRYKILVKEMEDVTSEEMGILDFAYLDACGMLTRKVQCWIEDVLTQSVTFRSDLCFTFSNADRKNEIKKWDHSVYLFHTSKKTDDNSNDAAITVLDRLGGTRIVQWGRAYKEKSHATPMLTFHLKFGWKQKDTTGKIRTYDLGYA